MCQDQTHISLIHKFLCFPDHLRKSSEKVSHDHSDRDNIGPARRPRLESLSRLSAVRSWGARRLMDTQIVPTKDQMVPLDLEMSEWGAVCCWRPLLHVTERTRVGITQAGLGIWAQPLQALRPQPVYLPCRGLDLFPSVCVCFMWIIMFIENKIQ